MGSTCGIDAEEFFINFEDAFELAVENFARNVGHVQIDGLMPANSQLHLKYNFVNGASGNVARDEVAVFRVPLFQEIETVAYRELNWARACRLESWRPRRGRLLRALIRSSSRSLSSPGIAVGWTWMNSPLA